MKAASQAADPAARICKVLYVDDDHDIRVIASLALELHPELQVETCDSGEAALDALARVAPDLIVLDVMMPKLDGRETLKRIRQNPRFTHTPVVFATSKALPAEVDEYLKLGALGVIPKPFDPMELAQQILEHWRASLDAAASGRARLRLPPAESADPSRGVRLQWLLESVLEVQTLINEAEFDLEKFMRRVVDVAQHLTGARGAVIELVDGDHMSYRCVTTSFERHVGLRIPRTGSLSGLCVEQARVLRCEDSREDPRVNREACETVGVRSMLCTPLLQAGDAVGVLKVLSERRAAFGADDEFLLGLLAGALGAALGKQLSLEALKTSEETFRMAMENASIGMALVKPTGQFLSVNTALCELLGYSAEELVALDFQTLTHPADLDRDLEQVRQVLDGKIARYRMEKRYFHKSGRTIWVLLSVSLVRDARGRPNYFVSQIQDISEQREMERVKSEFISTVSHELRTPLTSIRGALGLVNGAMRDSIPAKAQGLLDIAQTNSDRLILLINDILDIDKITSGNMRFDLRSLPLDALTADVVRANEAYAERCRARLGFTGGVAEARIRVDADRYAQALANLISNAAKFSPAGAPIEVRTEADARRARISVIDQGPGIPDSFHAQIFEKFAQHDSSATRRHGGTGLGLHITRGLVEHMGGRIGFDTRMGQGTTFWIEFPLA